MANIASADHLTNRTELADGRENIQSNGENMHNDMDIVRDGNGDTDDKGDPGDESRSTRIQNSQQNLHPTEVVTESNQPCVHWSGRPKMPKNQWPEESIQAKRRKVGEPREMIQGDMIQPLNLHSDGTEPHVISDVDNQITQQHNIAQDMNQPSLHNGETMPVPKQSQRSKLFAKEQERGKTLHSLIFKARPFRCKNAFISYEKIDVVHYRIVQSKERKIKQVLLPHKYRAEVMSFAHDIPCSAHMGRQKTLIELRLTFCGHGSREAWMNIAERAQCTKRWQNREFRKRLYRSLQSLEHQLYPWI